MPSTLRKRNQMHVNEASDLGTGTLRTGREDLRRRDPAVSLVAQLGWCGNLTPMYPAYIRYVRRTGLLTGFARAAARPVDLCVTACRLTQNGAGTDMPSTTESCVTAILI
jgi:hypothetical protein